ncbi:MAG TPA: TIGR02587 family membrane protein [Pyrinomonadaceae bacterium]|jgi:putative integral membrane protein (TIGR02587 family)|nr:TIGR02587 family membrane protein [Pyrinomonadaceae bacterium]
MSKRRKAGIPKKRSVPESLQEYGRGVAGGLLFSLPLLYTMEVWWAGFIAHPWRLLSALAATFVLLLGYNRYAGMRRDAGWSEVAVDSVEELGMGLVVSAAILFLLGRITFDMPANEVVGRVVIEALTVAIGVSVGTAQLGGGEESEEGMRGDGAGADEIHFGGQLVVGFCGAVLFAANVAPTEEIVMIAVEIGAWRLLGLALLSLALAALILFYSEFRGSREFVVGRGFKGILVGTIVTYAVALLASALILWFFARFDNAALANCVAQTIVLGVAATLGASAGRLLLQ